MSTTKRTVIKADEELVIKGRLTIEGNVTQLEQTNVITVTNLAGNTFTINSVDPANPAVSNTTAILSLNSFNTQANLSYSNTTGKLVISVPIELAANSNIETTGNVVAGWFHGNGSNISGLTTTIVSEGANLYYTTARARAAISVTDSGGDGSLSYSNTTGIITYTGPSASETRAHFSATDGIVYNSATGVFTIDSVSAGNGLVYSNGVFHVGQGDGITVGLNDIAVDNTVVRTSGDQDIFGVKKFESGVVLAGNINIIPETNNTSSIGNSTNWIKEIYSNVVHAHTINLGSDANLEDVHNTFYTGTAANAITTRISDGLNYSHNTQGAFYAIRAGDGLKFDPGSNLVVDSDPVASGYVLRASGDQSITGNITLTGNLAITGNLDVTANINSLNVVDLNVQDTQIILNSNAASGANSTISVNRGGDPTVYLKWDENSNVWVFSNDGATEYPIPVSTTDLEEGSNLYFTTDRANSAMDDYLIGGDGLTYSSGNISVGAGDGITVNADNVAVDATVVRTSSNQSIGGVKTFTGELSIPTVMPTTDNTIFIVGTAVYAKLNGNILQLTADSDIGQVEDVGSTGTDIYAGYRSVATGNSMVFYHGIKSIDAGNLLTISEASNVITLAGNSSAVRGLISISNLSGFGNLSYDNTTGVISYTGTSNADVRSLFSGTGLINVNSSTGVISTTADNYGNWSVQTDSGAGSKTAISSGHTLTITGTNGVTVTNTGNAVSITGLSADITAVTAGAGLTGGGSSGAVTLDVGAGAYMIINADNVSANASTTATANVLVARDANANVTANNFVGSTANVELVAGNNTLRLDTTGVTTIPGNVLPNANGIYSLGSPTARWKDLYVTSASIYIGDEALSVNEDGNILFGDAALVTAQQVSGGAGLVISNATLSVGQGNGITVTNEAVSVNAGNGLIIAQDTAYPTISTSLRPNVSLDYYANSSETGNVLIFEYATPTLLTLDVVNSGNTTLANGSIITIPTGYNRADIFARVDLNVVESSDPQTFTANVYLVKNGNVDDVLLSNTTTFNNVTTNTNLQLNVTNLDVSPTDEITVRYAFSVVGNANTTSGLITVANTSVANITLSNTGNVEVGAGAGILVNADNVAINTSYVRGLISATDAGGDGSFSYNNSTGVFTYTGPSASDANARMDAYLVGGNGLTYTSGTFAIGAGDGITVNADNVAVSSGIAGSGLTYSAGVVNVGSGNGITVGADTVAVNLSDTNTFTSTNTASRAVVRDADGSFAANVITATATSARYADLAENYQGDADYLPGTVLVFGGEAEVTSAKTFESTRVAGVVTTQPAHVMNSDLTGPTVACIALRGRVPVRVKGVVRKGDVLVTAGEGHNGYAVASLDPRNVPAAAIVGKAIGDKLDNGLGTVEALI
jgi:hypothetical protein